MVLILCSSDLFLACRLLLVFLFHLLAFGFMGYLPLVAFTST
jgi:hypothetical protein